MHVLSHIFGGYRGLGLSFDVTSYAAVLLVLVALQVFLSVLLFRQTRLRRQAPKKSAHKHLIQLKKRYLRDRDTVAIAIELSMLLRQVALTHYPAHQVAGLRGENWLKFLDKTGKTTGFSTGIGRVLIASPYQRVAQPSIEDLFDLSAKWLKTQ